MAVNSGCIGKCLTMDNLEGIKSTLIYSMANFHGANTPTMVDSK